MGYNFVPDITGLSSFIRLAVYEIFTRKDRKLRILPTLPLFDAPSRRNAMRYQRNLYTAEK